MASTNVSLAGIACRYPESSNVAEFYQNLTSGVNMITTDNRRWENTPGGPPKWFGKIPDISSFDAAFFGVHGKQASKMDPQLRLLLETSFEAIADAGLTPDQLRGSKTGVYVGSCFTDAHELFFEKEITGYENTGCAQSMFANRLSFFYDFHGPSMNIDTACSSGLVALCQAMSDLRSGIIDRALVGGSSVILSPHKSKAFQMLKMLSPTGSCKSFDTAADGYARAEGVAILVLSRVDGPDNAYLEVNSDGFTERGITFPNVHAQIALCKDIFERFKIEPLDVKYVEAHGTGTVAGDGEELEALSNSYRCKDRSPKNPLYVGSVKSNMGHCEGGSGIAGLVKLCLASRNGVLPGNLHFQNPNPKLVELAGSCQVVVEPLPMQPGDVCGISSFGFGGTNAHVVVKLGNKRNVPEIPTPAIDAAEPWMTFTPSFARTEEGAKQLLANVVSQTPIGPPLLKAGDFSPYPFRGVKLGDRISVAQVPAKAPPVYLVFGGNGSQWQSMGKSLYENSAVFRASMDRCIAAGRELGVELETLLVRDPDPTQVYTAAHGDMGLAAMQICLVDLIRAAGIKFDGILGHSAGETACGYADGCTTLKQTLQIAHARSTCVLGFPTIAGQGMMIAVGLTCEQAEALVAPYYPDIVVACHNSPDGVTLSGKKDVVTKVMEQLKEKGVFARAVETRGMAFHSPMLAEALPVLLPRLKEILPEPQARSAGWISTCFLEETPISKTVSAEYHVHNFSNRVEFCTAVGKIPAGAVLIELSPHAIMANATRRTRSDVGYVGLMKTGEPGAETVARGLADAWKLGVQFDKPVIAVGPKLLAWDHSAELAIPRFGTSSNKGIRIKYDVGATPYLLDHKIDGRPLMPAASYLYSVWMAFAQFQSKVPEECPVRMTDVVINQAIQIDASSNITFEITFGNGPRHYFELCRGEEKVVQGSVDYLEKFESPSLVPIEPGKEITKGELYGLLARSGYEYGPEFQGVVRSLPDASSAIVANKHLEGGQAWIPFIDSLLHLAILGQADGTLRVPVSFRQVDFFARPLEPTVVANRLACGDLVTSQLLVKGMITDVISRKPQDLVVNRVRSAVNFLPYGPSEHNDAEVVEYSRVILELMRQHLTGHLEGAPHLVELKGLLEAIPSTPLSTEQVEALLAEPSSIWLRMINDLLKPENIKTTLEAPIRAILQHSEHSTLYGEDLGLAVQPDVLNSILHLVEENFSDLEICEIGCGTGGLTRHVAGRPTIRRYVATDVSQGFLNGIDNILGQEGLVEKAIWDIAKPVPPSIGQFNLVLASNALHTSNDLEEAIGNAASGLCDGGFLLAYEWTSIQTALFWGLDLQCWTHKRSEGRAYSLWTTRQHWASLLERCGLELVQAIAIGDATAILARKRAAPTLRHHTISIGTTELSFEVAKSLLASLSPEIDRTWLVGANPGLPGLVRCLHREPKLAGVRCVVTSDADALDWSRVHALDALVNIVDNGILGCHLPNQPLRAQRVSKASQLMATFPKPGDLSCIEWQEIVHSTPPQDDEVECKITYSSLNFKDVMLATGKLNSDAVTLGSTKNAIGFEFSGLAGDRRVMGFGKQTFATHVRTQKHLLFDVPESWNLREAASIPTAYATVYYSLFVRAGFSGPGQSILIHAGAGGVGQAAIRVALSRGARVLTTCSPGKVDALLKQFPGLAREDIANSRDTTFESVVQARTGGKGVDYVLNSLSGELLQASIRCLKQHGHFLEIGKYDLMKNTKIGTAVFLRNASFHGIDVSQIFDSNDNAWERTRNLLTQGIASGEVKPLNVEEFSASKLSDAFHFMGSGKHWGKVVVNFEDLSSLPKTTLCTGHFAAKAQGTYLIVGGLGGVGLELCRWLVSRGARDLVVTSTRGVRTVSQGLALDQLRAAGASVRVSLADVSNLEACRALFAEIDQLAGVFHLAMLLQDSLLQNMTGQQWDACVTPKALAAEHLDQCSRARPECTQFVVFSSISSGIGNAGQSNYGFANSYGEGVCLARAAAGLPALAIQWGMIGDVGYVANLAVTGGNLKLASGRLLAQGIVDCFAALEGWLVAGTRGVATSYNERLRTGSSVASPTGLLDRIASVLGISAANVDPSSTLSELGADSIQSIEIQSLVERANNAPPIPVEKLTKMKLADVLSTTGTAVEPVSTAPKK